MTRLSTALAISIVEDRHRKAEAARRVRAAREHRRRMREEQRLLALRIPAEGRETIRHIEDDVVIDLRELETSDRR